MGGLGRGKGWAPSVSIVMPKATNVSWPPFFPILFCSKCIIAVKLRKASIFLKKSKTTKITKTPRITTCLQFSCSFTQRFFSFFNIQNQKKIFFYDLSTQYKKIDIERACIFTAADKPPSALFEPPWREFHLRLVRVASSFTRSTTPYTRKRNSDVGLLSICLFLRLALLTPNERASLFVYGSGQTAERSAAETMFSQAPKPRDLWVFAEGALEHERSMDIRCRQR